MSKYIIEIAEEYEEYFKGVLICGIADGKFAVDVIAREDLEELNSDYINEHFGDLQDTAYKRGLHDGYKDGVKDTQNEAWEAARKIVRMPEGDLLDIFTECYSSVCTALQVLLKYDASEVIEKLKAYEEKQKAADEIKVGDEVTDIQSGANFLVTHLWESNHGDKGVSGFNNDCSTFSATLDEISKTGRHFDIEKILEEIRK